ncbi:ABC transporter ATP-binding protein [Rhodomicrobium sp. Az07]|uniref:ABC transporter ATP-binding protein n=1 Tax=Rhodomicrobium sp. Az07 TaxID=2839034 RepID=UPI001BED10A2|nr:ABC transporter ATP-binding protein [Rhodomicrobium sp. Az07]MBT3069287.1 ABC transporter ATP-binding protein [Rhodomicrobium sp. Az07]
MSVRTLDRPNTSEANAAPFFFCRGLDAYYGDSYIVQNVSFSLEKGQILALLGRNGAGKTSTLRAIARATNPELRSGEICLDGLRLDGKPNYIAAQAGIQLVQEDRRIIPGLTVEQNLQLAIISGEVGWPFERIYALFPRLAERRKQEGTTMSGGEQQMLAIARALARDVKLLLLDEPYEGLAPVVRHDIAKALLEVRAAGITSIIVEQNAVAALHLSDRAVILDSGEVVYDGAAKDVLDDEELRLRYLAI